jgi:DNA-binding CsgD family transcriptional regulator
MTQELFLQLIHQNLLLQGISITLIVIFYFVNWFILINLGLQILKLKLNIRKIILPVFIMFLFSFAAKPFLSTSIQGPIMVALFTLLLTAITEKFNAFNILKSAWAVILTILVGGAGSVFVISLFCLISKNISIFFLHTILGNISGTLTEDFLPFLALLILRKNPKVTLIYPIEKLQKIDLYDTISICTFGAMFYLVYSTSSNLYQDLRNNLQHHVLSEFIAQCVAAIAAIGGTPLLLRFQKKKYEYQRQQAEYQQQQAEYQQQQAENERQQREEEERLRELEQQKYETEKLAYEDRIVQLEQDKDELNKLYEQLKANTINPEEAIMAMQVIAKNLKDAAISTINQQKSYIIPDNEGNPVQFHLTPRQKNVLGLIVKKGISNKEIADILNLRESWIKHIVGDLLKKTNTADRTQLAILALTHSLVDENDLNNIVSERREKRPKTS